MKKQLIILLSVFSLIGTRMMAEDMELSSAQITSLEELNLTEDKLEEEASSNKEELEKALAAEATARGKQTDMPSGLASIYGYQPYQIVEPLSEGLSYIDGARCHVGHYAEFSMITVFEGINRGCQLTLAHDGRVLFIHPSYSVEVNPIGGHTYKHDYDNASVMTGHNQVIYMF